MPWRQDLLEEAKRLAKRKDAVLAVELIFQVGNQTDWRDLPTPEHPHGKRKAGASAKLNAIMAGVKKAGLLEFGRDRIISIDLHTDESTPHVHIVFTPIEDGKLQAKHWFNGPASCAQLRERMHQVINQHIACDYEKGKPGGKPHDPTKAAGAENGPKPKPTAGDEAANALQAASELQDARKKLAAAEAQIQTLFSRLKRAERMALDEKQKREDLQARAVAAELAEKEARLQFAQLERGLTARNMATMKSEGIKKPLLKPS
nr:mobilization protein [Polaromonas sp.]